jgi:hypothetical protein
MELVICDWRSQEIPLARPDLLPQIWGCVEMDFCMPEPALSLCSFESGQQLHANALPTTTQLGNAAQFTDFI